MRKMTTDEKHDKLYGKLVDYLEENIQVEHDASLLASFANYLKGDIEL